VCLGSREATAETAAGRAGEEIQEIQGREIKGGIKRGRAAADTVLQREEEENVLQLLYSQMDAPDRVTLERQREQVLEELKLRRHRACEKFRRA